MTCLERIAQVGADIAEREGSWTTADWSHESGVNSQGEAVYCEGNDPKGCKTCREVEKYAAKADHAAAQALVSLGKASELIQSAINALGYAAEIERVYGDSPTWGPVARAAKKSLRGA